MYFYPKPGIHKVGIRSNDSIENITVEDYRKECTWGLVDVEIKETTLVVLLFVSTSSHEFRA